MHPLESARRECGMSRERLAAKAGVSAGTIYAIERRGVHPQRATQAVICMALCLFPEQLFAIDAADDA